MKRETLEQQKQYLFRQKSQVMVKPGPMNDINWKGGDGVVMDDPDYPEMMMSHLNAYDGRFN